jgi:NAD-dependent dihydropyrimidine dehydrogenase PreA subunit
MIEVVSEERCIKCDICVRVCPTNVFDAVPDAAPVIARQQDCQTCFMCELYCPVDALFVAPQADEHVELEAEQLSRQGLLGSYRAVVGWGEGRAPGASKDRSFQLLALSPAPGNRAAAVPTVEARPSGAAMRAAH